MHSPHGSSQLGPHVILEHSEIKAIVSIKTELLKDYFKSHNYLFIYQKGLFGKSQHILKLCLYPLINQKMYTLYNI